MPDTTLRLGLPLLAAGQAQKHVTHNEALGLLDALVQLACRDKDLAAPPADPAEGDRYLVAAASPTGAWAGLSGQVVRRQDGVWVGAVPAPGWLAYVIDEADLYVFTGTAWTSFRASLAGIDTTARLGVNTAADARNRLAVKSEAVLFSWDDATPGAGDMRATLNRKAAGNDAGLIFQTGFASRALVGTLGDDDLVVKVSPDGAAYFEGLRVKAGSGLATFPNLLAPPVRAATFAGAAGGLSADAGNRRLVLHDGATPGGWPAAGIADLPGRNAAINGNFAVNQRGYGSGAALPAGAYGHDRWKAGAGGCTYTFAQAQPDTAVTVAAGTLVQVVDAPNVHAAAWWLTWAGTAQARVWQGSAAGPFSAGTARVVGGAPVNALLVTGLTVGTPTGLEFSGGSLNLVQFEAALPGAGPTRFERRHGELALCQRYYVQYAPGTRDDAFAYIASVNASFLTFRFPVPMRAVPTVTFQVGSDAAFGSGMPLLNNVNTLRAALRADPASTANTGPAYLIAITASAEL